MDSNNSPQPLTYRDAGVDIAAGNELVERIKPIVKRTHSPNVLAGLGGFGGLMSFPVSDYRDPVMVAGTDGVGTKLLLAQQYDAHDTVGIDLVAMCVNDIVVQGARPLFFLDYYATSRLDKDVAVRVIEGIAAGCTQADTALIGGETAEMPGLLKDDDYDLAGFAVGVVERERMITGAEIAIGDRIIGIASSGAHSNGFSLIRKILESSVPAADEVQLDGTNLIELLLRPTKIYVSLMLRLFEEVNVRAAAHITGGGLTENVPRVLPPSCRAHIDANAWPRTALFNWLQQQGNVADEEMWRTFNCGIGMVLVVPKTEVETAHSVLRASGETSWDIGEIVPRDNGAPIELIV